MRNIAIGLLAGMALVGCAREDRWTPTGIAPSPLEDHRAGDTATAAGPSQVAVSSVPLIEREGAVFVRNTDPKRNLMVTLQVTPSGTRPAAGALEPRKVLVPADSEVQAGRTSDDAGTTYKYRVLSAQYK